MNYFTLKSLSVMTLFFIYFQQQTYKKKKKGIFKISCDIHVNAKITIYSNILFGFFFLFFYFYLSSLLCSAYKQNVSKYAERTTKEKHYYFYFILNSEWMTRINK